MLPRRRDTIRIMSREEWGARPPLQTFPLKTPVKTVVVFPETNTDTCQTRKQCIQTMREVQNRQMDVEGYPDIIHNFFIGMDGRAYEGTGWHNHGVKIRGHPKMDGKVLSICHIGDFQEYRPWYIMREAVKKLVKFGVENKYIKKNYRKGKWLYDYKCFRYDDDWFRYHFTR